MFGCYRRKLNHRINNIHERALKLFYKEYISSFDDLLIKDNQFRIHHRNLQNLDAENKYLSANYKHYFSKS